MANSEVSTITSDDDGNIDRQRIVHGHPIPEEDFCPICQHLLWKPCSCLSRLKICCRNGPFVCTQILSYDLLEHHENVQCQYLTEKMF